MVLAGWVILGESGPGKDEAYDVTLRGISLAL
jgi:hypothetical protein